MRILGHRRQTSIVLSNEDYTNAGLKQEDMMKAIKEIDGVWMVQKHCINSNIVVHINGHSREYIRGLVLEIRYTLESML